MTPDTLRQAQGDSYYGRPVVKPHVWTPFIPWYFWIGGTAGVAAVHSLVERVRGNTELADAQRKVALAGVLIAPPLLILDLGVPLRFYNMLRVFKPTSPMSVGSWVLLSFGGSVSAAIASDALGWKPASRAFDALAAVLGPVLTTYTAVLIADTATPIWHDAHRELPFVFVASGIAGAGACGTIVAPFERSASARRLMIGGALGMVGAARAMEHGLGTLLAEPYNNGRAGSFKRVSGALSTAGILLGLIGGNARGVSKAAAALVALSGVFERFAILAAGKQSAKDPKYTVVPQRERVERRR